MIFDVDEFFADSFPVVLSASVDLDEGDNKQLDTQALSNYFDTPMVIDEIRVQVQTGNLELYVANFGGSVRLLLSLGRYALSDTYIPVGCFGPTFDGGTMGYAAINPSLFSPESFEGGFVESIVTGYFRWKLPRPLVCPVGMPLEAKISRQVEGISSIYPDDTISVNVAYAGRVARKQLPPDITIPIPYVGLFENVFTSANVVTSGQRDLYNPFQAPLNVQRFVGRWQNIYLNSGVPRESWIGLDDSDISGGTLINFPLTQIRMFDGFYVTDGFIPGPAIFEGNTRSFAANIELAHGEGFEVTIDATAGVPSTGAQPSPTGSNTSFITMIGWRNENL